MLARLSPRPLAILLSSLTCVAACSAGSGDSSDSDSGQDEENKGDGDGALGDGDGSGAGSGDGDLSLGDGDGDGDGDSGICETVVVTTKPNPAAILVLLDQSGSMKASEGGNTRWQVATSSLGDAMSSLDAVADFGLIGFPTHVISSDADASQTCNAELKALPAPSNGAQVTSTISAQVPNIGHTPVRAALELAGQTFADAAFIDRQKYVVLITDGLPNCKGIAPNSAATSGFANYEDPSDAVSALSAQGVTTFVVGYAISGMSEWSEGVQHFAETYANNMAAAGGTETHRPVSNGAELAAVLGDITASVAPCSFDLAAPPTGGETYIRVTIDDTDYALGDAWTLEGEQTVALTEEGAACMTLRDGGEHNVRIQVECQPVVVK